MLKQIITLLFLNINFISLASNTVIKGVAKDFDNSELSVYIYDDFITGTKEKIGFSKIGNTNNFEFNIDINTIKKVELAIEDKTTWFFIEPGGIYNITLSYSPELNKGRIYDRFLSLKFNFPAPTELNQLIAKFNRKYDDFISTNESIFLKRDGSITPKIQEFGQHILNEFKAYNNDFAYNYAKYTIASTFNSIDISYYKSDKKSLDKADIFIKYLQNNSILYNNPEYMNFFTAFFNGEIKKLTLQLHGMDITKAINEENSYNALVKALEKYPFLENKELLNLFLINGLKEIGNDKYFNQKNIISILTHLKTNSIYPEQQKIAANVITKITYKKLAKGSNAPTFKLPTIDGKEIALTDFNGKYVYINFWASWSIPSLREMKIMETLHKQYKDKVAFISICTDNDKSKIKSLLKENPNYSWTFVHLTERELMQAYEVRTLPTYVLIGKEGEILRFPAPRPGGNIERPTEENIERMFFDLK